MSDPVTQGSASFADALSTATPSPPAADPIADRLKAQVDSTDIPLEQQTPWQRYEMASFGDNRPSVVGRTAAERAARAALQHQLSEQIASSREQARAEGHAEGYAAGFEAGRLAGLAQGREDAAAEREQLTQLLLGLPAALAQADHDVSKDLMSLALDIAKAMLKTALPVKPELVLPIIEDAIAHLPSVQQPAVLMLHPDDFTLVQTQIGDGLVAGGWRLQPDPGVERGGCRIETGSNQIDADTATRWKRIAAALQLTGNWLDA